MICSFVKCGLLKGVSKFLELKILVNHFKFYALKYTVC